MCGNLEPLKLNPYQTQDKNIFNFKIYIVWECGLHRVFKIFIFLLKIIFLCFELF